MLRRLSTMRSESNLKDDDGYEIELIKVDFSKSWQATFDFPLVCLVNQNRP